MEPPSGPPAEVASAASKPPEPAQRWRLTIRRAAAAPTLAQRDWHAAWEASLAASGLPVAQGEGSTQRPRLAVGAPLPQGMAAERELLEVFVTRRLPVWQVREALIPVLPEGHELIDLEDVWLGEPALPGRVVGAEYEATLAGWPEAAVGEAVGALLDADVLPRERTKGDRVISYDLRPFVADLDVRSRDGTAVLWMRLRHDPERGVGRPDEVLAELADRLGVAPATASLVRTCLVLAPPRGVAHGERAAGRPPGRARRPSDRRQGAIAAASRPRK